MGVADKALAAVSHAQGAVYEKLDAATVGVSGGANLGDLFQCEFTCQHNLREAHVLKEAGLFNRANIGLRTGVQLNRRQIHFQQGHVLHDQRIGPRPVHIPSQLAGAFEFVIPQDGVSG